MQGYTAFIDVLGFRRKVTTVEDERELFTDYSRQVQEATERPGELGLPEVSYAVFSDSIILYNEARGGDGLASICIACSGLYYRLLGLSLPPRGAIAYGSFQTDGAEKEAGESRIVYGQPIMEAVDFESRQDWVGIMLAPSVRRHWKEDKSREGNLVSAIHPKLDGPTDQSSAGHGLIREHPTVPLRSEEDSVLGRSSEPSHYEAYVILPNKCSSFSHSEFQHSIEEASQNLEDMLTYAPNPRSQQKYRRAIDMLSRWEDTCFNSLQKGWK